MEPLEQLIVARPEHLDVTSIDDDYRYFHVASLQISPAQFPALRRITAGAAAPGAMRSARESEVRPGQRRHCMPPHQPPRRAVRSSRSHPRADSQQ